MSKSDTTSRQDSDLRLNPVSYVVLGLIQLRGPSTSYDLKRAVERSIQYFWPFPHSQLYVEPDRLAQNGLLELKQEQTGRRKKVYTITAKGELALFGWMQSAPAEVFELRDLSVMQLFFAELMGKEQLGELAKKQIELHQERIGFFEDIASQTQNFAGKPRLLPLKLGVMLSETFISFWREELENPDD